MARFVTFPGTAGSYASTDPNNVIDADTSHLQQSLGTWSRFGGTTAEIQAQVLTPIFGDFHGQVTFPTDVSGLATPVSTIYPVTAGLTYIGSFFAAASVAGIEARLRCFWIDSGGGQTLGNIISPANVPLSTSAFTQVTASGVAPVGAVAVRMELRKEPSVGVGDFYWDAAQFREGTDSTFVPSIGIVGDLDMSVRVALVDFTPAVANTLFSNLSGVTGFRLLVLNTNVRALYGDGTTIREAVSGAYTFVDGTPTTIRVTYATDGSVVWYQDAAEIDTDTVTVAAASPSFNTLSIGAAVGGAAENIEGDVYGAEIRDGIDGPIVAVFDPEDIAI